MKISYEFLEHVLEVPAMRLSAFSQLLNANGKIEEDAELRALIAYSHLLKYAPPEIAGLLVAKIFAKHEDSLQALSVVNKVAVVSNGTLLWDLTSGKEIDVSKLQGIYEQHGVDLDEFTSVLEATFKDVETKRAQRRAAGAPRAGQVPPASGTPESQPASPPGPASA